MTSTTRTALFGMLAALAGVAVACGAGNDAPASSDPEPSATNDGVDAASPPPGTDPPSTDDPDASTDASLPDSSSTDAGSNDAGSNLPIGAPIDAPPSAWTWVDFPEAVCDDGTSTGIGLWHNPASTKVMFFFAGGGACWDYDTCIKNPTSVHGPFGKADFDKASPQFGGWIIGHGDTNPFKDWTTVYVPYCTGDLHAGDLVKTYTDGTTSKEVHHKGRANVAAYLARLAATIPSADQVAVTGSSAGGGGALFSYPAIRSYWPNAKSFLVDDSLPFFKKDMPLAMRQAWFDNWNLAPLTTPICGANCVDDMSKLFPGMATLYPNDPMALLSFTTDPVIASYYKINTLQYWSVLGQFTKDPLEPTGHFKHYYVDQWGHTMLSNPTAYTVKGVKLLDWIAKMASADPSWASVP